MTLRKFKGGLVIVGFLTLLFFIFQNSFFAILAILITIPLIIFKIKE